MKYFLKDFEGARVRDGNGGRWLRLGFLLAWGPVVVLAQPSSWKFDFGPGELAQGFTRVSSEMEFSRERGFGFEPGAALQTVDRGGDDELRGDFVTSDAPFFFTPSVAIAHHGESGETYRDSLGRRRDFAGYNPAKPDPVDTFLGAAQPYGNTAAPARRRAFLNVEVTLPPFLSPS